MTVPERTAEQRRAAARQAVAARRRRVEVAAQLKTGALTAHALLELARTDEAVAAMRVSAVLVALPRFGPRRSAEAMSRLRVSPSRRLRGLGSAQRRALLDLAAQTRPAARGDNTVRDDTVGDDTVGDDTVRDGTVRDGTVRDDTVRDDTVRDDTVRDDTVRDDTARDDTARDDTARDDTARDEAVGAGGAEAG